MLIYKKDNIEQTEIVIKWIALYSDKHTIINSKLSSYKKIDQLIIKQDIKR